jgi:uracil-DNA glycosylase
MSVSERPNDKIESLGREAASCQACQLWKDATQTVFGEGPPDADVMFIGKQPGEREDREGRPFVGPAGLLLDKAIGAAFI